MLQCCYCLVSGCCQLYCHITASHHHEQLSVFASTTSYGCVCMWGLLGAFRMFQEGKLLGEEYHFAPINDPGVGFSQRLDH